MKSKQARFQVKKGQSCDPQVIKDAVAEAGNYSVTNIQPPAPAAKPSRKGGSTP
jgi:hypothetical protein